MLPSSSNPKSSTLTGAAGETQSLVDPKAKLNEAQGTFDYEDQRNRIIRDLTEIHEVTWIISGKKVGKVHVKYLRYATIMESDIHLTTEDKRIELNRILRQMIKWTSLKHPNILPYLGYQWKDKPLLIFSWYKNGNISLYLKDHPDADRLKLLAEVSRGLAFLHSQSIVHGAIKPNNVIIADDAHAMLMDFGMAPDLRAVERNMTIAESGREQVGYMSPELIEEGNYTEPSDVYAFAALILEIMSGQPPFYKLSYVKAMIQITLRSKPSPEDHQDLSSSSPLWELMQRCWSTLPQERPNMNEVCSTLEQMTKSKRRGLFGYLGSLCNFAFRLVGLRG